MIFIINLLTIKSMKGKNMKMLIKVPQSAIFSLLLSNPQSKTQIQPANVWHFCLQNQYFKILGKQFSFDGLTVAALRLTHVIAHITFWEWCWGSKGSSPRDEELLHWRWLTSLRWEPAPPPPVHRGRSEPWNQGELTQPGSTPCSESLMNRSYIKIKIMIQQ